MGGWKKVRDSFAIQPMGIYLKPHLIKGPESGSDEDKSLALSMDAGFYLFISNIAIQRLSHSFLGQRTVLQGQKEKKKRCMDGWLGKQLMSSALSLKRESATESF